VINNHKEIKQKAKNNHTQFLYL